jgi:hypothetical protein
MVTFDWAMFWHELWVVGLAFTFHEIGHIWMAKRRKVFNKVSIGKLFGFFPFFFFVHTNLKKGTVIDQLAILETGVWLGLPFILFSWDFSWALFVYMVACGLDVLNIWVMSFLIFKGVSKTMTLEKVVKKYKIDISWKGIKIMERKRG